MKLAELLATYEERARLAAETESSAPVAKLYRLVLAELRQVDGIDTAGRWLDTAEAADVLGVSPKTVRRWCNAGDRFPSARKTSDAGEWRIPAVDIYGSSREENAGPRLVRGQHG